MTTPPRAALAPALTAVEQEIARLTVFGLDRAETILGEHVAAGQPLRLELAAKVCRYRLKKARAILDHSPAFNALRRQLLADRRDSERPRNLATLIRIRDTEGAGLAADRTVQLKAISAIEGTDKAPAVTVNVSQTNNNLVAGYVIRLGKFSRGSDQAAIDRSAQAPLTIEHEPLASGE